MLLTLLFDNEMTQTQIKMAESAKMSYLAKWWIAYTESVGQNAAAIHEDRTIPYCLKHLPENVNVRLNYLWLRDGRMSVYDLYAAVAAVEPVTVERKTSPVYSEDRFYARLWRMLREKVLTDTQLVTRNLKQFADCSMLTKLEESGVNFDLTTRGSSMKWQEFYNGLVLIEPQIKTAITFPWTNEETLGAASAATNSWTMLVQELAHCVENDEIGDQASILHAVEIIETHPLREHMGDERFWQWRFQSLIELLDFRPNSRLPVSEWKLAYEQFQPTPNDPRLAEFWKHSFKGNNKMAVVRYAKVLARIQSE